MRLISTKNSLVLVDFSGGKATFSSSLFEREMKELGIPIPPGLRSYFEGKDTVFLDDPNFERAFKEVYYTQAMDPHLFKWEEENEN